MAHVPVGAHRPGGAGPSSVLRVLQLGQHALFAALLLLGAVRGAVDSGQPLLTLGGSLLLALWYVAGALLARRRRDRVTGAVWLAVLLVGWAGLVLVSPDFSWLAFPLFFLCLHLLPGRGGLFVVAGMTAVVVAAQLATAEGNRVAQVLGPSLGALVTVGMSVVYRRLVAENVERQRLVAQLLAAQEDLLATNDALAATQRESGALAERARLARDIHDTLAQGFSSILLLARAGVTASSGQGGPDAGLGHRVAPSPSPGDGAGDIELLRQIATTAAENLDEARRVVHALAPAELERAPLAAAMERLLERTGEQTGITVPLHAEGDPVVLPTAVEVALLRVAQAALANVRQHAHATRAGVTLTYGHDEVRLDVVDDGVGFDPALAGRPTPDGAGFGLRSMQERLEELGGGVDVESAPGAGTAVAATVPLPPLPPVAAPPPATAAGTGGEPGPAVGDAAVVETSDTPAAARRVAGDRS